jgi:phospholipase C
MPIANIRHLVVLMMENRSFDNMLGMAYDSSKHPNFRIPSDSPIYFGVDFDSAGINKAIAGTYWNPGPLSPPRPVAQLPLVPATKDDFRSPKPDPGEHFDRITTQIFGGNGQVNHINNQMRGFVLDYGKSFGSVAAHIMRYYTPEHVPVITSLARNFAVCDRWFAASPTQTLPNRSFVHTGTSCGKVNNQPYNPFDFDTETIFNVLDRCRTTPWEGPPPTWKIYKDTYLRFFERFPGSAVQFPKLWNLPLDKQNQCFRHLTDFHTDALAGTLPTYSFIEPRLLIDGNDQHPSRDIRKGEMLMYDVYQSIKGSPNPSEVLFVIIYDEHGGCYDHVPPPFGAVAPDDSPGELGFKFDRYGVRVPAIVISPLVQQGTVFRSDKRNGAGLEIPFDHTSILATLREWLAIPSEVMLPSHRVAQAPILDDVLSLTVPRTMPEIASPVSIPLLRAETPLDEASNDLEKAYAIGLTYHVSGAAAATHPQLADQLDSHRFLVEHVVGQVAKLLARSRN